MSPKFILRVTPRQSVITLVALHHQIASTLFLRKMLAFAFHTHTPHLHWPRGPGDRAWSLGWSWGPQGQVLVRGAFTSPSSPASAAPSSPRSPNARPRAPAPSP